MQSGDDCYNSVASRAARANVRSAAPLPAKLSGDAVAYSEALCLILGVP